MRLATLLTLLFALASCDTTTNAGPPIRVLVESIAGGTATVLADVEVSRSALVGNSVSIDVPRGILGFDVRALGGDSTGAYAVVSTNGPETILKRFGTAGSTPSTVFSDEATAVTFVSTDSLWTGVREAIPVRIETGLTTRSDTLRRDRHRATPARLLVEARGLPVVETALRVSVIAPRDLRLAPIATIQTGLPIPGGAEDEELFRNEVRLLRASLGDRARYVTRIEDVAGTPEAGPLNFDIRLDLLLLRIDAGL